MGDIIFGKLSLPFPGIPNLLYLLSAQITPDAVPVHTNYNSEITLYWFLSRNAVPHNNQSLRQSLKRLATATGEIRFI